MLEAPSTTSPTGGMEAETKLFLEANVYPILTKGLAGLCKEKPANPSVGREGGGCPFIIIHHPDSPFLPHLLISPHHLC